MVSRTVEGTVVSADITGFTRLAESLAHLGGRHAAEALIRTINRCFDPMIDLVYEHGGDVLKLGGDALFALFAGERSSERAAACAAAIVNILDGLNDDLPTPLSMTVGVAGGPIGLILAGSERRDLIARGPTVDECLRLEAEAEPGEVLVSATTASLLPEGWASNIEDDLWELDVEPVTAAAEPASGATANLLAADSLPIEDAEVAAGRQLADAFDAFVSTIGEIRLVTVAFIQLDTIELDDDTIAQVVARLIELCETTGVVFLGSDVAVGGVKFFLSAGAPVSGEDDEDAMLRLMSSLVLDPEMPPMKAGVNRGHTYAGFLGSERNRTFTTMGDPTNLAARLLGKADERSVAVAQSVLDHSSVGWTTTEMAPILVKGRIEPVVIHQLVGADRRRTKTRPEPPFVGRKSELELAAAALAAARRSAGGAVQFVGRRGVGLTRLLDEIDRRRPSGVVRFRVDGRSSARITPYGDIGPILSSVVGIDDNPDPKFRRDGFIEWMQRVAPELVDMAPLLAPAVGVTVPPTPKSSAIEPEFRLDVTADLAATVFGRTLTTPTLFLIDDLHRLDAASRSVFEALARSGEERPWAIVPSARVGSGPLASDDDVVEVSPLPADEVLALVAEVAPDLADETRSAIVERSGGNPYFAVELALAQSQGSTAGSVGVIDNIESLVTAQIDRLGHQARVVLRTASVLGQIFDVPLLRELLDVDESALGLDELGAFIEPVEGRTYKFRAAVVWEVAYEGLSTSRRSELHAAIAELLEDQGATPAVLALHHSRAGKYRQAIDYGRQAAAEATELGMMADATNHLQLVVRSIDSLDPPLDDSDTLGEVLTSLFYAGVAAGRHVEAIASGERACGVIDDRLDRMRLLSRVVLERAEIDGSYDSGIEELSVVLAEIGGSDADAASRAWLLDTLASLKHRRGDLDGALAAGEQAYNNAEMSGQLRPLVSALHVRHIILGDRGDPGHQQAWEDLKEAAERLGDPKLLSSAHSNMGLDMQAAGDWRGAAEHFASSERYAHSVGDRDRGLFPAINRAALLSDQGRREDARTELDRLRREAVRFGAGRVSVWALRELGRLEAFAGNRDLALGALESARAWFSNAGSVVDLFEIDLTTAAAELGAGRSEAVFEILHSIDRPPEPNLRQAGWSDTLAGFAHLQQDNPEAAVPLFERAIDDTVDKYRFGEALALFGRSEAERFLARNRTARRTRAEADAIFQQLGVVELPYIPLPR